MEDDRNKKLSPAKKKETHPLRRNAPASNAKSILAEKGISKIPQRKHRTNIVQMALGSIAYRLVLA
ncbi:hypothetical protein BCS87_24420 [Vibrio splendidus]|nr:hypothetical protein BCT12_13910 [Vibrio breoganii]PMP42007.1 hypothetical protein BCS87_24420 [Vibrio splendidus]